MQGSLKLILGGSACSLSSDKRSSTSEAAMASRKGLGERLRLLEDRNERCGGAVSGGGEEEEE